MSFMDCPFCFKWSSFPFFQIYCSLVCGSQNQTFVTGGGFYNVAASPITQSTESEHCTDMLIVWICLSLCVKNQQYCGHNFSWYGNRICLLNSVNYSATACCMYMRQHNYLLLVLAVAFLVGPSFWLPIWKLLKSYLPKNGQVCSCRVR